MRVMSKYNWYNLEENNPILILSFYFQMNRTEEDFVEFSIHATEPNLDSLRSECLSLVSQFSVDYMWHQDVFNIEEIAGNGNYLKGKVTVGDNVEDEWFTISLLLELSKLNPDLVIRVVDQDGEVLLIETADHLPKWAQDPNEADGRAFLHQGELHLIPVAQTPAQLTPMPAGPPPSIPDAANVVRRFSRITRAPNEVQTALKKRIGGYPADWSNFQHYSHYVVPSKVKILLDKHPTYCARAIRAFYQRDMIDVRALRIMKHFKPVNLVKTGLTTSKCLYSMLAQQQYKPDKRAGWPSTGDDAKAVDLGMKLACGFEILVNNLLKRKTDHQDFDADKFAVFVKSLNGKGFFQNELEGSAKYCQLMSKAKSYFEATHSPQVQDHEFLQTVESDADKSVTNEKLDRDPDDDSWMNFDSESFDQLLTSHFKLKAQSKQDKEDIPQEVKRFLSKVSDFEGADVSGNESSKPDEKDISFNADDFERVMKKVLNIQESDDEDESDEEDMDADIIAPEMAAYDADMKEELAESKVFKEEEDEDLDKPLDIDTKVLKNLLQSFNNQEGISGPAATLLKPLGIDVDDL